MATQPNWWDEAPLISPANDPSFTGYIPGTPKAPPVPANYEPDPDKPGAVRPIKGGPADPTAGQNAGASDLTGEAYLGTLDKPTGALVKALAEGRKSFPSGAALRNPYWQNMLTHVSNYDPGFDETTYTGRSATRRDFSVGTAGKNIRALNTAIGHLGQLYEQIGGTASHGLVPLNVAENKLRANILGESGPTTYASTTSALSGELTAVYRGSGGAEADIQRYISELSPNASEEQKKATIKNIAGLLNSRLEALQDQYSKGMGVGSKDFQFLDPHAQEVLNKIGGTPPPPPSSGGGGGTNPPGMSNLTDEQKRAYAAFVASHNGKPDGDQVRTFLKGLLNVTDVPNADAIAKSLAQGGGINTTVQDLSYEQKIKQRIGNEDKLGIDDNPATTLATQGGTLGLSDEAAGVGEAAANILTSPFTGKFDPVFSYQFGRDAERQRIQSAREQLGYGGTAIELASGLGSAGPSALAQFTPRAAGAAAAAGGALSGFGYGEGAGESVTGLGVGALGGYALGRYAPAVAERMLPRGMRPSPQMAPELARAADAENVDLLRSMVDPASRGNFGELEGHPASQAIIRGGVENTRNQLAERTAALGQGGTAMETGAAGERAQGAARRFIQRSRGVATQLYNRAENLAGDVRFVPQNAIDQIEAEAAQLRANPETNAGEIRFLEGLHSDLATPGGKTVAELRGLRESLRGRINEQNLTATQAQARAIRALDATQQDVAANVPAAATAYRRADTYYRERMTHIDDVLQRFLGGNTGTGQALLSGEQAFKRLKSMASPGGDGRRLAALMRELDPGERQDIAATIAQGLGRDAPDQPFSAAKFLSQTRDLSPSARRTIFGPDGAQSIDNLRRLSQAFKDAGGDVNFSRSGSNVIRYMAKNFVGSITGLGGIGFAAGGTGGAATGAAGAAAAASIGAGRRMLSARSMINPRVSRWLADAVNVNTQRQAQQQVRRLSVIIAREPAIAGELQPIYEMLRQRVSQPLAAEPGTEGNQNE